MKIRFQSEGPDAQFARFEAQRAAAPLHLPKPQLSLAATNKAVAVIWMRPDDFLQLTTMKSDSDWAQSISDRPVQPLAAYNKYIDAGKTIIMPHLSVSIDREDFGWVTAHEGRHRAAAVLRDAPGARLAVSINIRRHGSSLYYEAGPEAAGWEKQFKGLADVPVVLWPQTYDWERTMRLSSHEVRRTPVRLGAGETKDAIEPWVVAEAFRRYVKS